MEKRFSVYVSKEGKAALEKILAFNPKELKRDIVSELLIIESKKYKGRKPSKKVKSTVG